MSVSADILDSDRTACVADIIAETLWKVARQESELAQMAVAWVIYRRLGAALSHHPSLEDAPLTAFTQYAIESVCEEVIAEAAPVAEQPKAQLAGFQGGGADASNYKQVHEVARCVWNGDFSDPTSGATRCCRHDRSPCFVPQHPPLALLGSFLFYR
jgi:hypothetical protein